MPNRRFVDKSSVEIVLAEVLSLVSVSFIFIK